MPRPRATSIHPDDEALSAYLDGEADAAELATVRAHLDSCAACRDRINALGAVRDVLQAAARTPLPIPPPAARDAAIGAALGSDVSIDGARRGGDEPATAAEVLSPPFGRRGRAPRWWAVASVAAALVVAGIALAVSRGANGTKTSAAFKASSPARQSASGLQPSTSGSDLGQLTASTARDRIRQAVAATRARDLTPAPTGPQLAPAGAASASGAGAPAAGAAPVPCLGPAAQRSGVDPSALVLAATATYQGTPAEVLVFQPAGTPTAQFEVMSRAGCGVLTFGAFVP